MSRKFLIEKQIEYKNGQVDTWYMIKLEETNNDGYVSSQFVDCYDTCYEDIAGRKDDWYIQWTMTEEEGEIWKQWMVEYFKKECKYHPKIAEREAAMINLMWGLKYRN